MEWMSVILDRDQSLKVCKVNMNRIYKIQWDNNNNNQNNNQLVVLNEKSLIILEKVVNRIIGRRRPKRRRCTWRRLLCCIIYRAERSGYSQSWIHIQYPHKVVLWNGSCLESHYEFVEHSIWLCVEKKDVWDSARSAFGMSVVIPLLGRGMLDVGYVFNQKRFTFSFISHK